MASTASVIELGAARIAAAGTKASMLATLHAAGLPVPEGVVVLAGALDPGDIEDRVRRLGERLAVRSSSPLEDGEAGAAPGVFASVRHVAAGDLIAAIEEVRRSADTEVARTYCRAVGVAEAPPLAVLVHRWIEGCSGTLHTRSPDDPARMIASTGEPPTLASFARETPVEDIALPIAASAAERLRQLALVIEPLHDHGKRGLDIEWVVDESGKVWIVQARALPKPSALENAPEAIFAFAARDPSATWRWDVAHNPEPLSAAQEGLVALVRSRLGARLEVAAGFLYEAVPTDPGGPTPSAAELEALFFDDIWPELDARLAPLEAGAPTLAVALDAFVSVYKRYQDLGPPLRRARSSSPTSELHPAIGAGLLKAIADSPSFSTSTRRGAAARAALGEADHWNPYAPRWDVAEPTYGEGERTVAMPDRTPTPASSRSGTDRLADVAHAVAELDDRLFYRAQRLVRRAILALPDAETMSPFDFGLDELAEWERSGRQPAPPKRARATRWRMPLEVSGTQRRYLPPARSDRILRGRGSGPQCSGIVSDNPGGILVALDLTPGEAIRAGTAAGIVLERSSLLGHGATMARQFGVPIVTAVAGATTQIHTGERVWLDGDAGVVIRLASLATSEDSPGN